MLKASLYNFDFQLDKIYTSFLCLEVNNFERRIILKSCDLGYPFPVKLQQ